MEAEEPLLAPHITPSSSAAAAAAAAVAHDVEDLPPEADSSGTQEPTRMHPLRRSRTAPALVVPRGGDAAATDEDDPKLKLGIGGGSLLRQASTLLLLYLSLGALAYSFNRHHFSGDETHPVVDSLYFCVVTLCTIGYGDITPLTPAAKALSCVFVLVGFGCLDVFLAGAVGYVLDLQEGLLAAIGARGGEGAIGYIFDAEKGRMRIRMKVALALGVVVLCIAAGTTVLSLVEGLDWVDSFYLSVMSVTTVGYGDKAFKTLPGRLFASVWLLVSTIAVARSFLFLAEARIARRHRRMAKWVLQRAMTVEDLLAADLNHTGFISKSEFVVYKLKEMGKIGEKDVLLICNQFKKLDPNNSGKITLQDLLNGSA